MKSSPLGSGPNANTDDSSTERTEWVCLGVVTRPHGVRGEVRVHPFNQDSDLIGTLRSVRLRVAGAGDELSVYKVRNSRRAPKVWLLALEGVQSMESAEALRGHELCITRAEMPPPNGVYPSLPAAPYIA